MGTALIRLTVLAGVLVVSGASSLSGVWAAEGAGPALGVTALSGDQQAAMLADHNRWRAKVGVPELRWADDLAQSSAQWAAKLLKGQRCIMVHSQLPGLGENLYWASPLMGSDGSVAIQTISTARAVDAWGHEDANYDLATNTCQPGKVCGHYTQLVWKTTQEVGCAKHICPASDQVWVCQYRPAGNVVGERPY
ncbi:CAP domain-containing protein [Leptothrix ochracea]|uniref:CAP domain-containing protein n=3 Tax=Leptothrix ochracea TaxID=735331 RepID=UPI0034E2511A